MDISTIDLHVPFSLWHLNVTRWTNLDRRNGNGQESHWKVVNHWWSHGWRCHERIDEKPDYNHLGSDEEEWRLWQSRRAFILAQKDVSYMKTRYVERLSMSNLKVDDMTCLWSLPIRILSSREFEKKNYSRNCSATVISYLDWFGNSNLMFLHL